MTRFWISGIAAVALLAATGGEGRAADLPVKAPAVPIAAPVVNWSGFYIGGNVGIAWSRDIFDFIACENPVCDPNDPNNPSVFETFRFSPASFIGGGQIGFQSQVEKWVLGIEATWSGLDLHQSKASVLDPTSFRSIKIDEIATIGARFGYAGFERTLIYIRAAYATARIGVRAEEGAGALPATPGAIGEWRGWRSGWNMGAGIEYMPWQNLVLGIEFNFYNFAFDTKQPITFSDGTEFEIGGSEADVFAVTARLSYLFNWGKGKAPVVAKY
jgi:outer membrane immunogenic protein